MKLFLIGLFLTVNVHAVESVLKPCPDRPNCVTSLKHPGGDDRYLESIKIHSNKSRAKEKITKILQKTDGFKIEKIEGDYIIATHTSWLMGFVDDIVFFFTDNEVHFRSSSRKGYWDMGANKKRIERIRFQFHQNDIN